MQFLCPNSLLFYPSAFCRYARFGCVGEFTISTADLPDVGVTYPIGIDGYPSIDIGNADQSAQTWDFSTINPISIDTATFAGTEGTPSPADYPNATVTRLAPLSSLLSAWLNTWVCLLIWKMPQPTIR